MIRMIFASSWVMALAALRDRTALLMTFVLPAALFVVFAAIFSGATGKELKLKVGLLDLAKTENTLRFVAAIEAEPSLRIVQSAAGSEAAMTDDVRRGNVDVGLILRGDLARRPDEGPPPILVIEDATRPLAAAIMIGQAQRTLNEKLPNVALARILADVEASGAIAKDEREFLDAAFKKQQAEKSESGFSFARIVETRLTEPGARQGNVLYYAGAVVAVFLLFAASHGALRIDDLLAEPGAADVAPHWDDAAGQPPPLRSCLALPVLARSGALIGSLFLGHSQPGMFSARSERIVGGIVAQAAVAIDNTRMYEAAQQAAEERKALLDSERSARTEPNAPTR